MQRFLNPGTTLLEAIRLGNGVLGGLLWNNDRKMRLVIARTQPGDRFTLEAIG